MELSRLEQVLRVNKQLESLYGIHTIKKLANFRLAYAGEQFETRQGTFSKFHGDVFCGEETGIREVPKYPYLDNDTWIVERLVPNQHQDVTEGDYIYECFYSFKPLDHVPPFRAVEFLIRSLFIMSGTQQQPKTEKDAIAKDSERKKEDVKKAREKLDEVYDYTEISMRLKHGAAVTDFNDKVGKQ